MVQRYVGNSIKVVLLHLYAIFVILKFFWTTVTVGKEVAMDPMNTFYARWWELSETICTLRRHHAQFVMQLMLSPLTKKDAHHTTKETFILLPKKDQEILLHIDHNASGCGNDQLYDYV